MPVNAHLTAPGAPPVTEYLVARLFGERLFPAVVIKAEELAGMETQLDHLAECGEIEQGANVAAVDLVGLMAAVGTGGITGI